ncbi:peroxiredoxin [Physocladia obscura]|uniref:thioredoxin-dependent peroxiredoxin n=1 Tax=Physocladia obscura TaxID=109957 RepID=A0AAD5XIQ1_9FUNG|nr:peroxiredoxin [Physocladia obscura]
MKIPLIALVLSIAIATATTTTKKNAGDLCSFAASECAPGLECATKTVDSDLGVCMPTKQFAIVSLNSPTVARVKFPAPFFQADAVVNQKFTSISLDQYRGKWLVLFFYPLDFTFVCPTEIIAFSDRANEFRALNAEVVGASVDSKHSHLAWTNQPRNKGGLGKINIPLLSDITKKISADYGVLIEQGPDVGLALRGTFIIDPLGVVRQITINDLDVGRSVDETLRLIEAFQYHEKHGEVCQAGWTKGNKGMIADPVRSKEYFESVFGSDEL